MERRVSWQPTALDMKVVWAEVGVKDKRSQLVLFSVLVWVQILY